MAVMILKQTVVFFSLFIVAMIRGVPVDSEVLDGENQMNYNDTLVDYIVFSTDRSEASWNSNQFIQRQLANLNPFGRYSLMGIHSRYDKDRSISTQDIFLDMEKFFGVPKDCQFKSDARIREFCSGCETYQRIISPSDWHIFLLDFKLPVPHTVLSNFNLKNEDDKLTYDLENNVTFSSLTLFSRTNVNIEDHLKNMFSKLQFAFGVTEFTVKSKPKKIYKRPDDFCYPFEYTNRTVVLVKVEWTGNSLAGILAIERSKKNMSQLVEDKLKAQYSYVDEIDTTVSDIWNTRQYITEVNFHYNDLHITQEEIVQSIAEVFEEVDGNPVSTNILAQEAVDCVYFISKKKILAYEIKAQIEVSGSYGLDMSFEEAGRLLEQMVDGQFMRVGLSPEKPILVAHQPNSLDNPRKFGINLVYRVDTIERIEKRTGDPVSIFKQMTLGGVATITYKGHRLLERYLVCPSLQNLESPTVTTPAPYCEEAAETAIVSDEGVTKSYASAVVGCNWSIFQLCILFHLLQEYMLDTLLCITFGQRR